MRKQMTKDDMDWQMFADYYKIYQDFYIPEASEKYWQELAEVSAKFANKYKTKYAFDLMALYLDSRELMFKLKKT